MTEAAARPQDRPLCVRRRFRGPGQVLHGWVACTRRRSSTTYRARRVGRTATACARSWLSGCPSQTSRRSSSSYSSAAAVSCTISQLAVRADGSKSEGRGRRAVGMASAHSRTTALHAAQGHGRTRGACRVARGNPPEDRCAASCRAARAGRGRRIHAAGAPMTRSHHGAVPEDPTSAYPGGDHYSVTMARRTSILAARRAGRTAANTPAKPATTRTMRSVP